MTDRPLPPFQTSPQAKPGLEHALNPKPAFAGAQYRSAEKLRGKVALVTGGDSGIGRSVSVLYAREGADVAIVYLPSEQSDAEATKLHVEKFGTRCLLIPGDLTAREFCDFAVAETVRRFGKLDILVHNAGYQERKDHLEDITDEEWDRTFRTNVYAYFYLSRADARVIKPGGCILATSSGAGADPESKLMDYGASKGAVNSLTVAMSKNLRRLGIRVNAVAPGPVWSPLNPADGGLTDDEIREFGKASLAGRPAQPEEIAPLYVYLASEADSSYVNGQIIHQGG